MTDELPDEVVKRVRALLLGRVDDKTIRAVIFAYRAAMRERGVTEIEQKLLDSWNSKIDIILALQKRENSRLRRGSDGEN